MGTMWTTCSPVSVVLNEGLRVTIRWVRGTTPNMYINMFIMWAFIPYATLRIKQKYICTWATFGCTKKNHLRYTPFHVQILFADRVVEQFQPVVLYHRLWKQSENVRIKSQGNVESVVGKMRFCRTLIKERIHDCNKVELLHTALLEEWSIWIEVKSHLHWVQPVAWTDFCHFPSSV